MKRTPLLLAALLAATAQAETSPYYVGGSLTATHASNLLRLGESQAVPAGLSKSDTITSLALLAGLDQPVGRQRVFGNVALRHNRFSNNDIYNNQGYSFSGGVDWETVERVSGTVRFGANRNLARFNADNEGILVERNYETTRSLDALVRVGVVTQWTFEGGAGWRSVDYSAPQFNDRIFREGRITLGTRWRPSGASNFGAAYRETRGRYPEFEVLDPNTLEIRSDRYKRRDLDLDAGLDASAASKLYARVSFGRKDYEIIDARDFSGVTGLLRWNWLPTGKLKVETRLSRDPGQDTYFEERTFSPFDTVQFSRVTNALRVRTDYEVTGKIAANASLGLARRSIVNTDAAGAVTSGSDRVTNASIGATWNPTRSVSVGCDISHERQRGDAAVSQSLSATTTSCFGQFTLQ